MGNGNEWRPDLDEDLRRYFSGMYGADAGLRSSFGSQLDRARDGVDFPSDDGPMMFLPEDESGPALWCRSDMPASCVDFGRGLGATRVEATLALVARGWVVKRGDKEEVTDPCPKAVKALAAFYTMHPTGAHVGLVGLQPYCELALYSPVVVAATKEWMARELEAELKAAGQANAGAVQRGERYIARRAQLRADLDANESRARFCWVGKEKRLRRQLLAKPPLARMAAPDVVGVVRAKWDRHPTRDELAAELRRIVHRSRQSKDEKSKAAAKDIVTRAVSQATIALKDARKAYAKAHGARKRIESAQDEDKLRSEFTWQL